MSWAQPSYLHFLWLVVALLFFYRAARASRRRALESFADSSLIGSLVQGLSARRRRLKKVCLVLAALFIIITLAQPQWGYHWQRVRRQGIDIVIAVDTSKSMLATDVKPDRLERARMEIRELLGRLQGDRVALVAFAGKSYTICPLTLDYGAVELFLKAVKVGVVPLGGTDIGGAIRDAVTIFEGSERKYKALVIISDGEDHSGRAEEEAKRAEEIGVKIYSVGMGSAGGELIPVEGGAGGKSFLKDGEGRLVQTRLKEETLKQIALLTGGAYVHPAGGRLGLVDLYNETILRMEKKEFQERQKKVYNNRFQWPLAAALLFLCLEAILGDRRRGK